MGHFSHVGHFIFFGGFPTNGHPVYHGPSDQPPQIQEARLHDYAHAALKPLVGSRSGHMLSHPGETIPPGTNIWVWLKIKRSDGKPQVLVHGSTYQGNPFWYRFFEPQPFHLTTSKQQQKPGSAHVQRKLVCDVSNLGCFQNRGFPLALFLNNPPKGTLKTHMRPIV